MTKTEAKGPTVAVTCELDLSDRSITHAEAQRVERALSAVLKQVLPEHRVRGLWVHSAVKSR